MQLNVFACHFQLLNGMPGSRDNFTASVSREARSTGITVLTSPTRRFGIATVSANGATITLLWAAAWCGWQASSLGLLARPEL